MPFKYLIVFFLSMIPILELRFAVPFAVGMDLPYLPSLIVWGWIFLPPSPSASSATCFPFR